MWAGAAGHAVLSALDPDKRAARLSTDSWKAQPATGRRRTCYGKKWLVDTQASRN
jgi:DNA-binding IclR family transcriptional regulator